MFSGVDVSIWQHPDGKAIDYELAVEKGVDFAIIEYRDESTTGNPHFDDDHRGFKNAGAMTGSYVYLHPELPIDQQAEDLKILKKYGPVWGDLEITGGKTKRELRQWWDDLTERAPGIGLVTYPNFIDNYGPFSSDAPLWVDSFGAAKAPVFPGIMLWGTTDKATVPGIPAAVDLDAFVGTAAQYKAIFSPGASPAPVPKPLPKKPRGSVIGVGGTPSAKGYFVAFANGDVLPFGDAAFHGSHEFTLESPAANFLVTPSGRGYRVFYRNGSCHDFGDARAESEVKVPSDD